MENHYRQQSQELVDGRPATPKFASYMSPALPSSVLTRSKQQLSSSFSNIILQNTQPLPLVPPPLPPLPSSFVNQSSVPSTPSHGPRSLSEPEQQHHQPSRSHTYQNSSSKPWFKHPIFLFIVALHAIALWVALTLSIYNSVQNGAQNSSNSNPWSSNSFALNGDVLVSTSGRLQVDAAGSFTLGSSQGSISMSSGSNTFGISSSSLDISGSLSFNKRPMAATTCMSLSFLFDAYLLTPSAIADPYATANVQNCFQAIEMSSTPSGICHVLFDTVARDRYNYMSGRISTLTCQNATDMSLCHVCGSAVAPRPSTNLVRSQFVLDWNTLALEIIKNFSITPPEATRILSVLHLSIHDAVVAIEPSSIPYAFYNTPASPSASIEAAICSASRTSLLWVLSNTPALSGASVSSAQQLVTSFYSSTMIPRITSLFPLTPSASIDQGTALGVAAASSIISTRIGDGAISAASVGSYVAQPSTPGYWNPNPGTVKGVLHGWGSVKRFAAPQVISTYVALLSGPPLLNSSQYLSTFNLLKEFGGKVSTVRTPDQTNIANLWAAGGGTVTPPGLWNQIASQVVASNDLDVAQTARLFATMNVAMADAAIACWYTKYDAFPRGLRWRPFAAIRSANAAIITPGAVADASWSSLLPTPNFPEYTSGHSTFSGAARTVLESFFPSDSFMTSFVVSEPSLQISRPYSSFADAALEASLSRIYGGIHFPFSCDDGLILGESIAKGIMSSSRLAPLLYPSTSSNPLPTPTCCLPGQVTTPLASGSSSSSSSSVMVGSSNVTMPILPTIGAVQNRTLASLAVCSPGNPFCVYKPSISSLSCSPGSILHIASVTCQPCPPGFYTSAANSTRCSPCLAGSYADQRGACACLQCPPGFFSSQIASAVCQIAPAGSVAQGLGAITTTLCPSGTYNPSPGGQDINRDCLPCPVPANCPAGSSQP